MSPFDSRSRVFVIADDYALSPGVSRAIRELVAAGRLTGTGCMTLFPEWLAEAPALRDVAAKRAAAIGLHLTLTDFAPLSGSAAFGAPRLPPLGRLIRDCLTGRADRLAIEHELDAQLGAFVQALGRPPDFVDGHQHVHFLKPVRRWLSTRRERLADCGRLPWLRAAPAIDRAGGFKAAAKSATVAWLARGFDREMTVSGFPLKGPLVGFYDWTRPAAFSRYIGRLAPRLAEGMVVMCHPGHVDETLRRRDGLVAAREAEYAALGGSDGWQLAATQPEPAVP